MFFKRKILNLCIMLILSIPVVWGQANADWNTSNYKKLILSPNSAYVKDNSNKRKEPIVLPPIYEEDVVWSMMIWRIIDLREKMNQKLYFPINSSDNRKNLMNVLLEGIKDNGLTAYDVTDDEFTTPITYQDIMKKLDAGEETIQVRNELTGELETQTVERQNFTTNEVIQFMLKEQWVFNKRSSRLQVRILGICPIRVYEKEGNFVEDIDDEGDNVNESTIKYSDKEIIEPKLRQKLFWVYYPEARPLLAVYDVDDIQNTSNSLSYDNLFIKRYFSSYIAQSSAFYGDKAIADYASGLEQIVESDRIKNMLRNFESDLWEH